MKIRFFTLIIGTTLLIGSANSSELMERFDPFEKFNRSMYKFNYNILDPYVVRPIAVAWSNHIPRSARNGLINFISNLEEPAVMLNYLLQGNTYHGMVHFTRFFLNTSLGLGGFIDVAGLVDPRLHREQPNRFGSTLGKYGVFCGPYLHLPFYGSFTLRNDIGDMVDTLYPTLLWLTWPMSITKWIVEGIETRAKLLYLDNLLRQSSDPYITVREVYFQNHQFIFNGSRLKSNLIKDKPNTKLIESELSEIDIE